MVRGICAGLTLVVCVFLIAGAVVPTIALGGSTASNEDPDPRTVEMDVPETATVGESFDVTVQARNFGGPAGAYSTISISSPTLDSTDDDSQFEVADTDFAGTTTRTKGEEIYTKGGTKRDADYLLVEGHTSSDGSWGNNEYRSIQIQFTPEQTGQFVIYIRTTMSDDGDRSRKFNDPSNGDTADQQNYEVYRYVVDVQEQKGQVRGQVTDGDGNPIEAAKVYLDDTNDVRTDENGKYEFSDVSPGDHELYVTAGACYENPTRDTHVDGGKTTIEDFQLNSQDYTVSLDSTPVSTDTSGSGTYDCGADVPISAPSEKDGHEFQQWVDPDGDVFSTNPDTTISYITRDYDLTAEYTQAGKPDLVISDLRWEPRPVEEGDVLDLIVEVENQGESRTTHGSVEFYIQESNEIGRKDEITLEPDQTKSFRIENTWKAEGSEAIAEAEADYNEEVDEEDESNNQYSETIPIESTSPDLEVTDIEYRPSKPSPGEDVEFRLKLRNSGDDAAENIESAFKFDGSIIHQPPVTDLAGGESHWTPWGGAYAFESSGSKQIVGIVDREDNIAESDETNNRDQTTVQVEGASGSVQGAITNANGDDLSGAKISLGDYASTETDSNGRYSFSDVPTGNYELTVDGGDCYDKHTRTTTVSNGETTTEDVQLSKTEYTVTLDSTPVAAETTGDGTYPCGTDVEISAPPEQDGYKFKKWVDENGDVYSENRQAMISSVYRDYNLTGVYSETADPDLVISDLRWQPTPVQSGDKIDLLIEITNRGSSRTTQAEARYSIETSDTVGRTDTISLDRGESETVRVRDVWTADGPSNVTVDADPDDVVNELDETNNRLSGTIQTGTGTPQTTTTATQTETPHGGENTTNQKTAASVRGQLSIDAEDVTVTIAGKPVTTDSKGRFTFDKEFTPDEYLVEYVYEGETYKKEVTIRPGQNSITLELYEDKGTRVALNDVKSLIMDGELTPDEKARIRKVSKALTPDANGLVFGDLGQKYPNTIQDVDTVEYMGGWMTGVMTPGLDVITDSRDCAVWINDGTVQAAADSVDCGGAVINTAGTAAAWTGIGAGVATAEEITDLSSILAKFTTRNPGKVTEAGQKLRNVVDNNKLAKKVIDAVDGLNSKTKRKLRKAVSRDGVARQRLLDAGIDEDTATTLEGVVRNSDHSAEEIAKIAKKTRRYDELSAKEQQRVARKLASRDDAGRLTDAYNGETLAKLGKGSGEKGDEALDKASDAARTGKADQVARIADEVNSKTLQYILETDSVPAATRHLDEGLSGAQLEKMVQRVKKLNGKADGSGYLLQYLKTGSKFSIEDVDFVARTKNGDGVHNGDDVLLLNTNKWNVGKRSYDDIHGWRKIVQKHVHPQAPGSWPVTRLPSSSYPGPATKFPKNMGPQEVKSVIETTIRKGNVRPQDAHRVSIRYSGSKLPSEIDKMKVVYHKETGRVITAHRID